MTLVGCDLHSRKQQVAVLDTRTGELVEQELAHDGAAVKRFYCALPPPVTNSRDKGTTDENKAVVQGSIAHFGKIVVSEADKTLTFQVETTTYPNWNGMSQKETLHRFR